MDSAWSKFLNQEFDKEYLKDIQELVTQERKKRLVLPKPEQVFRVFEEVPLASIKVCIVGMDPYPNAKHANGLAFAVNEGVNLPASLRNIFQEIKNEYNEIPQDRTLESWSKQGVFLINSYLTVREGKSGSHRNYGWHNLTDKAISTISREVDGVVYILWGNHARSKRRLIDSSRNLILESVHPSPLSAYRGFFGCNHFAAANEYLVKNGKEEVDWISDLR